MMTASNHQTDQRLDAIRGGRDGGRTLFSVRLVREGGVESESGLAPGSKESIQ